MALTIFGRVLASVCVLPAVAFASGISSSIAQEVAQVSELPPIEVTTSNPVKKSTTRKRGSTIGQSEPAPPSPSPKPKKPSTTLSEAPLTEPLPDTLPGTLLATEDTFSSVAVVTDRDIISSSGQTITEALQAKPGIVGSAFAPGASRPIIRGLDSYRVRTQENGVGSHDVAAISEDHGVPIDPNAADQIEVVRGPATLRYGSQAIGGVVAVENQRIPEYIPRNGFSGAVRGAGTSVDSGKEGSFKATAGSNGFAVHTDGFWRDAEDYDSPRGTVVNSFVESQGGALGASIIGTDGFFGVSVARIESMYGIPGHEAEEGVNPYIDLLQDKVMAKGEWRVRDSGIDAIRVWFGASNYRHNEFAIHDPDHGDEFEVGSRFTNKEQEARVELQHIPVATMAGELTGTIGAHWGHRNTRGQSFEGESLLEPAETTSIAAFAFEELELNPFLRLQAAARIEQTTVDGTGWESFHGHLHGDHGHFHGHLLSTERDFTPISGSLGALYQLPGDIVGRLTGSYVERAPDAAELFSKGMHEATGTFEVGNPFLDVEKATTAEIGLKKSKGAFRFDASAYNTRYNGFIYRQLQGLQCDPAAQGSEFNCTAAAGGHDDDEDEHDHGHEHMFDLVNFQQRDVIFYGAEVAFQYDVARIWNGHWGFDGKYDFVHAKFESGGYVPRIPPHRLGGGIYYRDANWFARTAITHAFDQDQFGEEEISTPGYTLISAELSYTVPGQTIDGITPVATIGIKGENLTDEEVLNHASFKRREDVLKPGASVRLFGTINLN